ncbi:dihydrolipoamide succinyltransferase [Pseudomonas oryzihabitans]|uniref:Dihydrolipoamide acetyltransferase component of pyruvate dehydrogenase complex n=1 Tax=Pseudomonas oryzihabitans TaxID=47885 RepID=A0A0U4HFJ2_9PSED|nr:2-oxo acid dehydrogenase subunit E2 [Pseudomonas oryzihabitans]ALZ84602.1 dihydrolipoamide succinyltransferase [Pseudomonas oryzihabitans]
MNDLTVQNPPTVEIRAPLERDGTRAEVRRWLKESGEPVAKDEPVVELETDKVVVEVAAPAAGILEILQAAGGDVEPGAVLGRIGAGAGQSLEPQPGPNAEAPPSSESERVRFDPALRLSPVVRRLLAEHDLDPEALAEQGTGRDGRLTREDVLKVIAERTQPAGKQPVPAVTEEAAPERPAPSAGPRVASQVPHSTLRRTIAQRLQQSVTVAPHVTTVFEADFTAVEAHRRRHKPRFAEQGVRLTHTAYLVLAAVAAMRRVPEVNSRWHDDYLEVFADVNLGIGTALGEQGLIVPVIHQAQALSLLGIATRLQELTNAARGGSLRPEEVRGGTFTLSNHGVSGSLLATPIIINQPQSAILGVGALEKRVVVREIEGIDTFQARLKAYVSLTIDHRVLDGSQANAWLTRFIEVIESWPLE